MEQSDYGQLWEIPPLNRSPWNSIWWYALFMLRDKHGRLGSRQIVLANTVLHGDGYTLDGGTLPQFDLPERFGDVWQSMGLTVSWYFDGQIIAFPPIEHRSSQLVGSNQIAMGSLSARILDREILRFETNADCFNFALSGPHLHFNASAPLSDSRIATRLDGIPFDYNKLICSARIRRFDFSGYLATNDLSEHVNGVGYFQRVVFKAPLTSWYWIYVAFPDGSIAGISCLYFGLKLFRRRNVIWAPLLENAIVPLTSRGYFIKGDTGKMTRFNRARVWLERDRREPRLQAAKIWASNSAGDQMSFKIVCLDDWGLTFRKKIWKSPVASAFHYHVYVGRVRCLLLRIEGVDLLSGQSTEGFANMEHTFGLLV